MIILKSDTSQGRKLLLQSVLSMADRRLCPWIMRKDVDMMCNLSQGIREKGRAERRAEGEARSEVRFILNMYRNNFTLEQIALATGKSTEEIEDVIESREPALA